LAPAEHIKRVNTANADAVVLSACVQMPSFQSVQQVENSLGLPVTTAAISTVYQMLKSLGLERKVENAGALLSGRF